MPTLVKLRYKGTDQFHTAHLSNNWQRIDPEIQAGQVMSASSGPKEYLRNKVISLFEDHPDIDAVWQMVLNRTPFFLMRTNTYFYDVTGREVEVQMEEHNATVRS